MTDPVLALVLLVAFFGAAVVVWYFRTLQADFWRSARNPVAAGAVAGVLVRLAGFERTGQVLAIGIALTMAALYARLTGEESEPIEGMLLGALSGAAAAVPLAIDAANPLLTLAECLLAGAVAGYGITFALSHVADKGRQVVWDIVTAAAAVGTSWSLALLHATAVGEREIAIATASLILLAVLGAVFLQWPGVRAELRHEASLGFLADEDVRSTAHPILRLGRGGWTDAGAHREFVRIANRIALRKRRQRRRADDRARIYELEVMKLRMQLQEMSRIEHAQAAREGRVRDLPSDTMRASE